MPLFPLRTNLESGMDLGISCRVYTVGTEHQSAIARLNGFSADQLFFTLSGAGRFRALGANEADWDILAPGTMLYIPHSLSHEYMPLEARPWHVGYVTYVDKGGHLSGLFGFERSPRLLRLADSAAFPALIEDIWRHSGPDYDGWNATERLFRLLVELKKQTRPPHARGESAEPSGVQAYKRSVVDRATRFLQDHLQRQFSLTELSSYVGYSSKQLVRFFKDVLAETPTQYLQRVRLQTAADLLAAQPDLAVRQAASQVGLEPIYFARLFRRKYGLSPSEFAARAGK